MQVNVVLFGQYARRLPPGSENGRVTLEVDDPASVGEVLDRLEIPPEGRTYVTVNGLHAGLETPVSEGDEIRVIVPLGGG